MDKEKGVMKIPLSEFIENLSVMFREGSDYIDLIFVKSGEFYNLEVRVREDYLCPDFIPDSRDKKLDDNNINDLLNGS